jgi:hypothetical protein
VTIPAPLAAGLNPIALDELLATAELQTRVDRKYIVPREMYSWLLEKLAPDTRVLEIDGRRSFRYESVYFDTPDLISYRGTAYGRRRRFKVRTRTYLDTCDCLLEIKTRSGRGETVKERQPYAIEDRRRLIPAGYDLIRDLVPPSTPVDQLRPSLITSYERTTLLDPSGARVTCDVGLICATPDDAKTTAIGDAIILETKSSGHACHTDKVLWRAGIRPARISKYGTGLALMYPDLPANRWNRTLRTHLGWEPQRQQGHCRRLVARHF